MTGRALKISVGKTAAKAKKSIFDCSVTDENISGSSDDEGRGEWKIARRTKKAKRHCQDCDMEDSGKSSHLGTQQKGKSEKESSRKMCNGGEKGQCGKLVLNNAKGGIACDVCMRWYHPSCQGLTTDAYNVLRDAKLVCLCSHCREHIPMIRTFIERADENMDKEPASLKEIGSLIDSKMSNLQKEQLEYKQKLEETVLSCTTRLEDSVQDLVKHMTASVVDKTEDIMATVGHQLGEEVGSKLDKAVEVQLGRVDNLERVIGNSMTSLEKAAAESQKTALSLPKITEQMKNSTERVVKMMEKEMDEARKKNILLHNIPESMAQDPKQRRNEDQKAFQLILSALLGEHSPVKAERLTRLGKPREGPGAKPRLLLVTLQSTDQVEQVYQKRFGLKEAGLTNIYVTKDLPPVEREAQRKLRQELAAKGRDKYCIFRGSVILREDRHHQEAKQQTMQ